MGDSSEEAMIKEATTILGEGEQVLAAGHFGLANLVIAQVAGGTAGALAGSGFDLTLGAAAGAGLGSLVASKAAAEAQGVTMKMLVAITPETIHVLNRDTDGRLRREVASFPRNSVDVAIGKVGLSRVLHLTDPASGNSIELHGSVAWISAQATGDKAVLALLKD